MAMAIIGRETDEYARALEARESTARELYEAEITLHDARQSDVDLWVRAASDRLHGALVRYQLAEESLAMLRSEAVA
ncbi:MAG: hypothetical protein QOK10_2461 [Pseudonocardiales bacterium]|jgi:dsDNA-binding SOS-regulon protein|nr:hypothetical protein [Pseudonocardiales bacterium]